MPAALPYDSPALRNPVGTHLKVGKGLVAGAFTEARRIGAETLQVFAGNPRGWASSAGDPSVDAAFRDACAGAGMRAFVQKREPRYMHLRRLAANGESSEFVWGPPLLDCAACGAEGIPVKSNRPSDLLPEAISRSPCKTCTVTAV